MTRQETREWIQTVGVGLLIPAAVAWLAYTNATRDVNAKMIEVAAQVLTGPVNDSMRPVRQWAGKMLQHYSPVPFSASAESTLTNYRIMLVPIPIASTQIVQLKVSPRSIGLLPRQQYPQFIAYGVTPGGDRVQVTVAWSATGGSITAEGGYPAYARYTAPGVPGDYAVIASSLGLADTALVHVQQP